MFSHPSSAASSTEHPVATGFDVEPLPTGDVLIEFFGDDGTTINTQVITRECLARLPVEERLAKLSGDTPRRLPTGRPQLSEADRLRRRAEASGDAAKAVVIAGRFHKFVKRLYVSQHAEIRYGPGGEQVKVWGRKYPKVWKNAGVWIDYTAMQIVFENHKGEAKSRLPLPPMKLVTFDGLEDGDLWGIARPHAPHVVERWGLGPGGVTVVRGYSQQ